MSNIRSVDDYLAKAEQWQEELGTLREILLGTDTQETVKWGMPCYTYKGKNVVGLSGFKSYFGLWFHQGALLEDNSHKLINAQEGKTRALRQWRMTSAKDIKPTIVRRYVKESLKHIDEGRAVAAKPASPVELPVELSALLQRRAKVRHAFEQLSPARRREYAGFVSDARRAATRLKRVEKIVPMILSGQGLHDKYRR